VKNVGWAGASAYPTSLLTSLLDEPPDLSVLRDGVAWEAIKENAGRFGVAPLVASVARSHVAGEERAWCDRVLVESWARHDRMLAQLEFVLGVLMREGIPTIALKGPLLAQRYYAPALLRKPSMDLDLAVAGVDLERACEVLSGVGYVLDMPIADAIRQTHHLELSHASRPRLEIHFRLTHRALGIPVEEFFERAIPWRLPNGQEALVLGAADQILHLVLHLAQSRFGTLFHLYEIRRVCAAEQESVRAEAVRRAVEHHYSGAFRMMDIAFRARWKEPFLPPGVELPRTWLNWRLTPELYGRFERWSLPGRRLSLFERLRARWMDFQLTDRASDGWRLGLYFFRTAFFYMWKSEAWRTTKRIRFAAEQG
jgi:hypothetical protein